MAPHMLKCTLFFSDYEELQRPSAVFPEWGISALGEKEGAKVSRLRHVVVHREHPCVVKPFEVDLETIGLP